MSVTILKITSSLSKTEMQLRLKTADSDRYNRGNALIDYVQGLMAGADGATIDTQVDGGSAGAKATGTLTIAAGNATANDTLTVGAQTFTYKASAASATEITIGVSATATAVNTAAKINALTALTQAVTATSALGVVTITCAQYGTLGNQVALAKSGTNLSVSAATLAGGVNPAANLSNFNA